MKRRGPNHLLLSNTLDQQPALLRNSGGGYLSKVTLPQAGSPRPSILQFLTQRFPQIHKEIWEQRIQEGKVLDNDGSPITADTEYVVGKTIFYSREVDKEPVIPFGHKILFQNDHLLVACKPHFLPVNPSGPYVAECLMNRLRKETGNNDLVPINRIDRETAGIVLFSAIRETRDHYCRLFREGKVEKRYEALAEFPATQEQVEWRVENRIVSGEPWFRMKAGPGEPNARSVIRVLEVGAGTALFSLNPLTGKTHQLRIHMSGLGFRILNDRYYPDLQPKSEDDFEKPLQLLAKSARFRDPVTGEAMEFVSDRQLAC